MKNRIGMGTWKSKIIRKTGKRSFTKSGLGRIFVLKAPVDGWKGGDPKIVNAQGIKTTL